MFLAELETRNFTFVALGETEDHARQALRAGGNQHARQYGLPEDWYDTEIDPGDVSIDEIELGYCYREHLPIAELKSVSEKAARQGTYFASLDTSSFSFFALGDSEENAVKALKKGLVAHGKEMSCQSKWYEDYGFQTDMPAPLLVVGGCIRDREPIAGLEIVPVPRPLRKNQP